MDAIVTPQDAIAQVFGFDRITVAIDGPELSGPINRLKKACHGGAKVIPGRLPFNPNWQARIELRQPSRTALTILVEECLGTKTGAMLLYAEPAWDAIFGSRSDALMCQRWLSARLVMRYQRERVQQYERTTYFARRANAKNGKRGRVGVVYADNPSKLASEFRGQPCMHTECRLTGSVVLGASGLISASDLIDFDHQAFWYSAARLYELPRKTDLGHLLGTARGPTVSGTALRKRANRFISECSIDGQFFMHNAAIKNRSLLKAFDQISVRDLIQ